MNTTAVTAEIITIDIANDTQAGKKLDALIGRPAIFTTYEGERLVGVIESHDGHFPRVRFPDGRWARLDDRIELAA